MSILTQLGTEIRRARVRGSVTRALVTSDVWSAIWGVPDANKAPGAGLGPVYFSGVEILYAGNGTWSFFDGDTKIYEVDPNKCVPMKVVGFSGLAGSGKTTAAQELLNEAVDRHLAACKLSFAWALRQICMIAYPWVPREYFCGNKAQKETQIPGMPEGVTGRKILQLIGTEAFRGIYQQTWVRLVEHQIEETRESGEMDLVVIDDVRFPNELEMLKRVGAVTLRCNREQPEKPPVQIEDSDGNLVWITPGIHESEAHIPTLPVDFDIDNNGTLDELRARVRSLLNT